MSDETTESAGSTNASSSSEHSPATTTATSATTATDRSKQPLGANYYKLFTGAVVSNLGDGMAVVAVSVAGLGDHTQPDSHRVRRRRAASAVADLHVAGRGHHRPSRPSPGDGGDGRLAGILTLVIAFAVLDSQNVLPGPDEVDTVTGTRTGLFLLVLAATLLLGMAEVLRDNSNQTILPSVVRPEQLEKANGRMWSIEAVTNTFAGPPLGSLLLIIAFSVPFFVDAGTFFVAAAMVYLIPGTFRAERDEDEPSQSFKQELSEGVRWLMGHPLLRPMAIMLGLMNAASMIHGATFVLFAQEVMGVGPVIFAIIGFGGAIGALVGGNLAPKASERLGSGTALAVSIAGLGIVPFLIGLIAWWPVVLVLFGIESLFVLLWNVITVSLRQTIIPPRLLGRVNSVYRFFAWGMMPIGAALGGVLVWVVERSFDRDLALRSTWFAASLLYLGMFVFGRAKLTTDKIEAARTAATANAAT